jgi:thiol-disulfide isomerase/thioredoxin
MPLCAAALQKNDVFPGLKGETLTGAQFELTSLKGEPILLKIGTSWCGTCRVQAKAISGLRDFLAVNGIHYVEVFIQEDRSTIEKYISGHGLQPPEIVLLDDGDIAKQLNIYLIPRIILIDRDFKVYRDGDAMGEAHLKKALQQMIAARSIKL